MRIGHCTRALRSQIHRQLVIFSALLVCAILPVTSQAGPLVIEQVARITAPDPSYIAFGDPMAVGGNSIIIGALWRQSAARCGAT